MDEINNIKKYINNIREYIKTQNLGQFNIPQETNTKIILDSFLNYLIYSNKTPNSESNTEANEEKNIEETKYNNQYLKTVLKQIMSNTPIIDTESNKIFDLLNKEIVNSVNNQSSSKPFSKKFLSFVERLKDINYFPNEIIGKIKQGYSFYNLEHNQNVKKQEENITQEIKNEMTPEFEEFLGKIKNENNREKLKKIFFFINFSLKKDSSIFGEENVFSGGNGENKEIPVELISNVLEKKSKIKINKLINKIDNNAQKQLLITMLK
jgi:hypothetical protein